MLQNQDLKEKNVQDLRDFKVTIIGCEREVHINSKCRREERLEWREPIWIQFVLKEHSDEEKNRHLIIKIRKVKII